MKRLSPLALASLFALSVARCGAGTLTEDFSTDPRQHGWRVFGDTNLFRWDATDLNLAVTWNSSNQNSYFYRPLGTIVAIDDDFNLSFDLRLNDAAAYGYGFELAVGLFRLSDATNAAFSRGGGNSPNLFEFDYFPPDGFGDPYSIDATLKDTNSGYAGFYFAYDSLPLDPGVSYHVILNHDAGSASVSGEVLANSQPYTLLTNVYNGAPGDFRLDTLSISSYADDGLGDSIFATGSVDNFVVILPPPPVQNFTGCFTNGYWQAQFLSRSNWLYTLERTADFRAWTAVSPTAAGTATDMRLQDTNAPPNEAFYRVRAARP